MLKSIQKLNFRCVLHGSFSKHFKEIKQIHELFVRNGIEVLAPAASEIKSFDGGFAVLESDTEKDQRMIELLYLHNLKRLGENGFSYFVDPEGYIGRSAAYELGVAQISNIPCFFKERLSDHPAYLHKNSVWTPEELVCYIRISGRLPEPKIKRNEKAIYKLWESLVMPGSVVAAGAIIEYQKAKGSEKEILLVKTHKWGDKYSVIGGKVKRNERLDDALVREIKEESGLNAYVGEDICTFDQIKNSGYYMRGMQHIFVDKVVRVNSQRVKLNEEAEDYIWMPARHALAELDIEPNARHTLELYAQKFTAD